MKKVKLNPCPFCGGEADLLQNAAAQWLIHCRKCKGVFFVGNSRNKASVYNAWNRRCTDGKAD